MIFGHSYHLFLALCFSAVALSTTLLPSTQVQWHFTPALWPRPVQQETWRETRAQNTRGFLWTRQTRTHSARPVWMTLRVSFSNSSYQSTPFPGCHMIVLFFLWKFFPAHSLINLGSLNRWFIILIVVYSHEFSLFFLLKLNSHIASQAMY